ncbi:restriction system protein [Nocardiopsis arvandica]|uniref:Restriction system protein n=1 Tax=Nocardiopsis sinuspersici TaxID=501010 RepID=A0A7Z0BGE8_9ACTN|nr:restriction endonuclease [Nocardiopsis sinuspersici]NYH50463.1 restriction system protein [Nocardiopsis sinuspersici]
MTNTSSDSGTDAKPREWRFVWRHRHALVLILVVALMVGTWLALSPARPLPWVAAALVAATLVWWVRRRTHLAREERALALVDLSEVDRMPGTEFEEHVARLMRVHGYTAVTVVGGAEDGGVDVLGRAPDGQAVAVQCKRWNHPVPPNEVRALIGVLNTGYRGYRGMFVASNGFTEAAAREGEGHMTLVDRDGLARWMGGTEVPEPPRA